MPDKIIIPFLLIAGAAATAFGMLGKNNYVFIAGIVMAFTGYRLIRRDLKKSLNRQQDQDAPDTSPPSDEE